MLSRVALILTSCWMIFLLMWLGRVLGENYWLGFFIWISMPIASLWVYINIDSNNEYKRLLIKIIHSAVLVLTLFNFVSSSSIKQDLAYKYIEGYRQITSHDCEHLAQESPFGDVIGEVPESCTIDDLRLVSPASKFLLSFLKLSFLLLLFAIPLITIQSEGFYKKLLANKTK